MDDFVVRNKKYPNYLNIDLLNDLEVTCGKYDFWIKTETFYLTPNDEIMGILI
jgi:hypothetical protein